MPKDLITKPFMSGQMDCRQLNQVFVVRWKDKRDVYIISTVHRPLKEPV